MLLEKSKEVIYEPASEPQKPKPRVKTAFWLLSATVVFALLALWASFFAGKDLNSVKERLKAGLAEGERVEICKDLKSLGYLIADCEEMPEEDLRELSKCLGDLKK